MSDARHTARPFALLAVAFSILMLFSWACGAPEQQVEPEPAPPAETPPQDDPPPRSDTITAVSQFLVCQGNPYALCYYSGPEIVPPDTANPVPRLPCKLGDADQIATCTCYAINDGSTNYVALPSILDPAVRQATEEACGADGNKCLNMANEAICANKEHPDFDPGRCGNIAPVCETLHGSLTSTFSLAHAEDYPISSTDCSTEPYVRYAGCMTAGCGEPFTQDGVELTECSCPTYVGPFQFGQSNDALQCQLEPGNVWSAANMTVSLPSP
ncbi:MAG: hypothetical protein AAF657_38420, partial [Acidobacteriota bacterium]